MPGFGPRWPRSRGSGLPAIGQHPGHLALASHHQYQEVARPYMFHNHAAAAAGGPLFELDLTMVTKGPSTDLVHSSFLKLQQGSTYKLNFRKYAPTAHSPPPPREGYPLTATWRESVSNKIRKKEEDERKMGS